MGKQTVKATKTKTRVKKDGSTNKEGYKICDKCAGKGIIKKKK